MRLVPRKPKPPPPPAAPSYAAWRKEAAVELESRHAVRAGTIPERVWKRLFVQGASAREAAAQAAVTAYNARPAADRLRRG